MSSAPAPPRILIVDDEFEMAVMLAEELGERGYVTVALRSAHDALARLRRETFDAVITDLRMPGVDGLTLLAASQALDPSRPVILMTAHGAVDTALEASRLGGFHYITKPFSPGRLVALLETALKRPAPAPVIL